MFGLVVRGILEYRSIRKEGKEFPYKWPLYFLVASSFWNFLGAGVFGFLINLPIVNYYEHGTYLTMNHAHGALFGVYGMLSIGLLLFSWRGMVQKAHWNDRLLKVSFFGLNIGLFLLTLGTLFPVGVLQAWTSYKDGLWVARDASFFERPAVLFLGTVRIIPDLLHHRPGRSAPGLFPLQDLSSPEGQRDQGGRIGVGSLGDQTVKGNALNKESILTKLVPPAKDMEPDSLMVVWDIILGQM